MAGTSLLHKLPPYIQRCWQELRGGSARRYLPRALMLAGLLLLIYVGVQYGEMYREQRRLAQQWQAQQAAPLTTETAAQMQPVDTLTRLSIPTINLNSIVVEGTSHHALLLGPGHMEDTPEPGEPGNAVITGHRDTFFRHVYELHKGDTITVQRGGHIYVYEVFEKKIVKPDDMAVAAPSGDNRLTLITCYPTYYIGPAPDRLVVAAKLIGNADKPKALAQNEHAAAHTQQAK